MTNDSIIELVENAIKNYVISLKEHGTPDDKIIEIIKNIDYPKVIKTATDSVIEELVKESLNRMKSQMYERVVVERANTARFLAHNEQIWEKGFVASEAMYTYILEMAQEYDDYLRTQPKEQLQDRQYLLNALSMIHGRACQQFLEITFLLKAGFADGAYARWRSLYELSIITEFISNAGEKMAESYCNAVSNENNWYDWAKVLSKFSNRKHVYFSDIQKECPLSTEGWLPYYKLANQVVHASPNATFDRLGQSATTDEFISAGHSDYGLAWAAINSAISLSKITAIYLSIVQYLDGVVALRCIPKLVDLVEESYTQIENECFNETDAPRAIKFDGSEIDLNS